MSTTQARQDIVTAVEAARATYGKPLVIQYENRAAVDPANQHEPWLAVTIEVLDSYQGDLAAQPIHRHIGFIKLEAHIKQGQGVAESLALLEHFSTRLQKRRFGIVQTQLADARPSATRAPWHVSVRNVPMWFDTLAILA